MIAKLQIEFFVYVVLCTNAAKLRQLSRYCDYDTVLESSGILVRLLSGARGFLFSDRLWSPPAPVLSEIWVLVYGESEVGEYCRPVTST